jgi:type VI secretion system protein ImpJ
MSKHHRVVWSEGMLLTPQHMQQWDRFVHHLVAERARASQAFEWGFTRLEVDRESLRNGRMALLAVRGVLPDGTPFVAPEEDPLPPPRAIEGHFDPKQGALMVQLGLPAGRLGRPQLEPAGSVPAPGSPRPRFASASEVVPDANTGADERPVATARPNLALLFPDDALGDHDLLPLAEIARAPDGGYVLRESFVPPCLGIGASEVLLRLVRDWLQRLITKSDLLSDRLPRRGEVVEFGSADSASFWQLQTVNAAIPALAHFAAQPRSHPEQVYLTLATLAGGLCSFSARLRPKDLPAYDHAAPGPTFAQLDAILKELIEPKVPEKAVRIELTQEGALHVGRIEDPRVLAPRTQLFLGIRADIEEQRLVAEFPAKLKIAAYDRIDYLIANALRGVPVSFARVPPSAPQFRSTFLYFQLDTSNPEWEWVRGAKNLALYAQPDYPGQSLELLGLLE